MDPVPLRRVTFLAFALAAVLLISTGLARLSAPSSLEPIEIPLNVVRDFQPVLGALRRRPVLAKQWRVAAMGDSTMIAYPTGRRVSARLQDAAAGSEPPIRVYKVAVSGMAAWEYYFLSESLIEARPDQIVVALNFSSLSDRWQREFARPELSGWIPPSRLVEATALPLPAIGVTLDRLLFYMGLVRSGAYRPWRAARERQTLLDQRMEALRVRTGEARSAKPNVFEPDSGGRRWNREQIRGLYGAALDGVSSRNPVVRMLGAAVARYRRAGIEVLVYVVPVNVEHFEKIGLGDTPGLESSVDALRKTVENAGGVLVDLHDLLPDVGFRDARNRRCPGTLARALLLRVSDLLRLLGLYRHRPGASACSLASSFPRTSSSPIYREIRLSSGGAGM